MVETDDLFPKCADLPGKRFVRELMRQQKLSAAQRQQQAGFQIVHGLEGYAIIHGDEFSCQAQARLEVIVNQMKAAEGVTEDLKRRDWLGWVRAMNSIRSRAEEIICSEMIYL